MNLEDALNSLKEAFSGKSAEAEVKSAELTKALSSIDSLKSENGTLAALRDSLTGDKAALEAKVASLEVELAKATAFANAAAEAQKSAEAKIETAGKKAAAIAASVGVEEPVEVSPVGLPGVIGKSNEEIAEEWAVLRKTDPKAASEFYTKHRSAIIAAAGLR
jgi:chromosome segregation ATPase